MSKRRPYVENVVLDVTDLDAGVLCSRPVLQQRLKPEGGQQRCCGCVGIYRRDPTGSHAFEVFLRMFQMKQTAPSAVCF